MASKNNLSIAMVLRLFSPSGGLELYALKLIEGLLKDGHKITVICEKDESNLEHTNLTVYKIAAPDKSMSKSERLQYYFEATSRAVAKLGPFDLVHSQHFPVQPVDVVTFHTARRLSHVGYRWERLLNETKLTFTQAYKARDKEDAKLARQAKMRIFVGAVMKDDFYQSYNLKADAPFAVAHPGASLQDDGEAQTTNLDSTSSNTPFTFLFVGKGFRKKGLDTLLGACGILKGRGHLFRLQIAGIKNKWSSRLQLKLIGLDDRVSYLGFRRDMPVVYNASQVVILPSKIEPFGMAPIQAMQFGLVPIVSAVCGVAEVLTDNQNCLILKDHLDKTELANLMQRLILDRELYKALQSQAKVTADRLNWRQTVNATEEAYARVLNAKETEQAAVKPAELEDLK